ncbi:hypothetical protein MMC17_008311 [Xylographa soralifera]|nr:hypothetical protein [Xylographa soralifera]
MNAYLFTCTSTIECIGTSKHEGVGENGARSIAELLLSQRADIEKNVEGWGIPLSVAASKGRADIVRVLLSAEANAIDGVALSNAVREGSIEIVQQLLAAGSKAEPILAQKPETVIDEAFAVHGLDDSVFRLLLDYAPPTMRRFVEACAAGSVVSVGIMLDKDGIDINGQDEANGDYPLQVAASHLQAEVVRLLLSNGADMSCKSAKHGTPLMTALEACAASTLRSLKSENVKKLVDELSLPKSRGGMGYYTDLVATAGFFEKTIFAAVQGDRPDIVALLLQKAPLTKHIHPEYTTPLHLACAIGNGASVRKLLEHGAKATVLDARGRTPLTIALEKKRQRGRRHSHVSNQIIKLHMQRSGGIGVTVKMLEAVPTQYNLEELLKHRPVYRITPEILKSQKELKCMKLLLDIDPETPVTEEVVFRALKIGDDVNRRYSRHEQEGKDVLEALFDRSPDIIVTEEMMQAVRCEEDMEILLKHLEPGTRISTDVIVAVSKLGEGHVYLTMRPLLKFDPSIRLDPKMALQMIRYPNAFNALEMLLEHDSRMPVTDEMFLEIFGELNEPDREELADLMHKYGTRLVFTDEVREAIDRAYQNESEAATKMQLYSLRVADEDDIESVGRK